MQYYVIKFVNDSGRSVVFPGTPVSSIYKTDRHDIAEVLLKVVLDTTTLIITRIPIIVMCTCFLSDYIVVVQFIHFNDTNFKCYTSQHIAKCDFLK